MVRVRSLVRWQVACAAMLGAVGVVEGCVPVDMLVRPEGSGCAVLEPCVLPSRHPAILPDQCNRPATASSIPAEPPTGKLVLPISTVGDRIGACSRWQ